MELLAPAGSFSTLRAAIEGGADAVYMGGRSFSARRYAVNFSDRELRDAISLAHESDVRAYVAVNTLVKDGEMDGALRFVEGLQSMGADAIILQDLGLLKAIRDWDIEKHASTQMGIHSRDGLHWAREAGISRVILARELSLPEISLLARDSPVELEVFVHGALCYSVSGQCLMSSLAGGRSGNRGACAQPCRKPYRMGKRDGYLLSCKDLNCLDLLTDLREAGVHALKIEGRMRGEAYTGIASSAYAKAIRHLRGEGEPLGEEERRDLETVFNRGMGQGYLQLSGVIVNPLYADNRGMPLGIMRVEGRTLSDDGSIHPGDGIAFYQGGRKMGGLRVQGEGPWRLPFALPDGDYDVYRNSSAGISAWTVDRPSSRGKPEPPLRSPRWRPPSGDGSSELSFYVSTPDVLDAVLPYADRIYYEWGFTLPEAKEACEAAGVEIALILPRFDPIGEEPVPAMPLMVNCPGQHWRHRDSRLYVSHHLNMFNSLFPLESHQVTVSPELSRQELYSLRRAYPGRMEQLAFGRLELMLTRDPDLEEGRLRDEAGRVFPVYRDRLGMARILNSADLLLLEEQRELEAMGMDSLGIDLRQRPARLASLVAEAFHERDASRAGEIRKACGQVTRGHYLRGVR